MLAEYYQQRFPNDTIKLNYTEWLGYGIFNSTLMIIAIFIYMQLFYFGIRYKHDPEEDRKVHKGPDSHEISLKLIIGFTTIFDRGLKYCHKLWPLTDLNKTDFSHFHYRLAILKSFEMILK